MKKHMSLLFLLTLFAIPGCGTHTTNQNPYSKYFEANYRNSEDGTTYRFYEGHVAISSFLTRLACIYETRKPDYLPKADTYGLSINGAKDYVHVYAQGLLNSAPTQYYPLGMFYDVNTFLLIYNGIGGVCVRQN